MALTESVTRNQTPLSDRTAIQYCQGSLEYWNLSRPLRSQYLYRHSSLGHPAATAPAGGNQQDEATVTHVTATVIMWRWYMISGFSPANTTDPWVAMLYSLSTIAPMV